MATGVWGTVRGIERCLRFRVLGNQRPQTQLQCRLRHEVTVLWVRSLAKPGSGPHSTKARCPPGLLTPSRPGRRPSGLELWGHSLHFMISTWLPPQPPGRPCLGSVGPGADGCRVGTRGAWGRGAQRSSLWGRLVRGLGEPQVELSSADLQGEGPTATCPAMQLGATGAGAEDRSGACG